MKERLTEKLLVGFAINIAISMSRALAITIIFSCYGIDIGIRLALAVAFSHSVLASVFRKNAETLSWDDTFKSTLYLLLTPWVFVFASWIASFLI